MIAYFDDYDASNEVRLFATTISIFRQPITLTTRHLHFRRVIAALSCKVILLVKQRRLLAVLVDPDQFFSVVTRVFCKRH